MKIIMNRSVPGSIDGIKVSDYVASTEYDLSASPGARSLAAAFVAAGMAVEVRTNTTFATSAGYPETFDATGYKALFEKADPAPEIEAQPVEVEPEAKPQAKPGKRK